MHTNAPTLHWWKRYRWALLFFAIFIALTGCNSQPETPEQPPLWSRIRDIERLTTVEYQLSTVVHIRKPRTAIHAATEELVYGVCGRVTAGIDLSQITAEEIREENGRLYVKLPAAEMFTVDLNVSPNTPTQERHVEMEKWTIDVKPTCEEAISWDTPTGFSRSENLIQIAHNEALKAFQRTAEESGILDEAQQQAEEQLRQFFALIGYQDVVFEDSAPREPAPVGGN